VEMSLARLAPLRRKAASDRNDYSVIPSFVEGSPRGNPKRYARLIILLMTSVTLSARAQVDWSRLDRYQKTITDDTFTRLVNNVYAPDGGLIPYLRYGDGEVSIYSTSAQTGAPLFNLTFADADAATPTKTASTNGTLAGVRIALDPGHIGGSWARMEERFLLIDRQKDWPVQEGALNVYVSRLIRDRLVASGAEVILVKDDFEPMSSLRPDTLLAEQKELPPPDPRFSHLPEVFVEAARRDALRKKIERDFYRADEIAARAKYVNQVIKPDVTLCVHFNATGWGDEKTLYEENGLTFFINGNYLAGELTNDDQKYYLLNKLLERSHETELGLSQAICDAFVNSTGLPPSYDGYAGTTMRAAGTNYYIFTRNLAASRQFDGPVIFLEPYFMNNRIVYARIQAGDYDGEREFEGKMYPSIFREYADAVAGGVAAYYAAQRSSFNSQHSTSK